MDSKIYVAVSGYYCTGSSAVIDLLKEYNSVQIASPISSDYEHMAFYTQGALFDLASILLSPYRSAYGSDMAINEFIEAANRLYENDFGWYGSYKKYYGSTFIDNTLHFVDEISKRKERQSAAHTQYVRKSIPKAILQIAARIIYKRPITTLGKKFVFDKNPTYIALPTIDEFQKAAKEYTNRYLEMCSKEAEINIYDHLLWPQQYSALDSLFQENVKMIIISRDPRDMYLLNKYYWHKPPVSTAKPYYPTEQNDFCEEWIRTVPLSINHNRVLNIYFEELVYDYENTVRRIESFLGLPKKDHIKKYQYFEPERSIENTQVFNLYNEWEEEIQIIQNKLQDYLYAFPYKRVPDKKLWFDTELQLTNVKTLKKIQRD